MAQALRLYREIDNGLGIRIITVVQDREAFSKYFKEGGHKVFEENSVCLAWGVSGQHAKEISDKAGFKSVAIATASHSAGVSADGGGQAIGEQVTPVLPVSDISQNFQGRGGYRKTHDRNPQRIDLKLWLLIHVLTKYRASCFLLGTP